VFTCHVAYIYDIVGLNLLSTTPTTVLIFHQEPVSKSQNEEVTSGQEQLLNSCRFNLDIPCMLSPSLAINKFLSILKNKLFWFLYFKTSHPVSQSPGNPNTNVIDYPMIGQRKAVNISPNLTCGDVQSAQKDTLQTVKRSSP